ncbi:hypothetical protein Adu01nite_22790 [Paractinoplanes durhamensis]|uniref:Uncharacterized protein n=1 Tax=Paractinoplanes durhamensis TaxID=113563 RepID=A0ABQ3YUB5_9ACTN|nr:hypothetical protein Adu01nite_22790 [Actinoplanes durhamensis]
MKPENPGMSGVSDAPAVVAATPPATNSAVAALTTNRGFRMSLVIPIDRRRPAAPAAFSPRINVTDRPRSP